jgi:hypothetical protein
MSPDHLLLAGGVIVIAGAFAAAMVRDRRVARRIYWSAWLFAIPVIASTFMDRGWKMAAAAAAVGVVAALLIAYMRTPYLKISGTIYAYTLVDSRPDPPAEAPSPPFDAYGGIITAPKLWWTLAIITCGVGALSIQTGLSGATLGCALTAVAALAAVGILDHRDNLPFARGQFGQFALVGFTSIPVFLAPAIAYVVTYYWLSGRGRIDHELSDDARSG